MRKPLILSMVMATGLMAFALEPENWDGVDIIPQFYSHKITHDGSQIVGESEDGGTVYYNIKTGEAYFYANCTFGRGYVISDNGWVVGSKMQDSDAQSNIGVIMADGEVMTPQVLQNYVTSNIHSITPDGSRVCGVVGGGGASLTSVPYYCDIDASGNFGSLQMLPFPPKDFFGSRPQYVTATWISEDGKTIAGQVLEARGLFAYPIIYKENAQGVWSYMLPSESLFNLNHLEVPAPVGDFEDEFPGVEYPDPTKYMNSDMMAKWNLAYYIWETNNYAEELSPYNNLDDYLTPEQVQEYIEAELIYNMAVEEYNEMNDHYWTTMIELADTSVLFVRNAMALSADGKWLTSSAEMPGTTNSELSEEPRYYYIPYLFNLETGDNKKIGIDNFDLVTNQVFANGDVLCSTPASLPMPPRSWIYLNGKGQMVSILDYIKDVKPEYATWMEEHISGRVPVAEEENGALRYEYATITGLVSASDDMSVMCGGVLGYAIELDMYLTYILTDMEAGVENIFADEAEDGVYKVYNMQGVKLFETKNPYEFKELPHGIYIINGRKILK